ncbi:MAG: hypothetical protein E7Y34_01970 [Mycoplasma sp.]|nr:hypothetical protein [Mycoplasma sp.]
MDEKFNFLNLKDSTNLSLFSWYATFLKQNNFSLFNNISEKLLTEIETYNNSYLYTIPNHQEYFWELALKLFIKNNMWKKVKTIGDAKTIPQFLHGSINGWDIVKYHYFPFLLISAITNILPTNQDIIKSFIKSEVQFRNKISEYIVKIDKIIGKKNRRLLTKLKSAVALILDTYIIAYETDQYIRKISNSELNEYVLTNKEQIRKLYGFSNAENFEKFISEGFSNGFLSKIHTTLGIEAIKDRAFFMYDKNINKNWNLDAIILKSQAEFRRWFPLWKTYTEYGSTDLLNSRYKLYPSAKGIYSFGAINASQGTWVGTYFGYIEKVKENNYTIDRNGDWLEHTSLNFEPRYTKISNTILEKRFVNETFEKFKILSEADYLTREDFNDYEQWEQYRKNKSNLKNHRSTPLNNIWTNKLEKILISAN